MNANASILLIDAGNTRIKWAIYRPEKKVLGSTQAHDYQTTTWSQEIKKLLADNHCKQVVLCNVAPPAVTQQIESLCQDLSIPLRSLHNGYMALGLTATSYDNPMQLGVDRCVLMIGARVEQPQGSLCVVSCGTAVTVDILAPDGKHKGGIISASPRAIRQKMLQDAAGINIDIDLVTQLIKMDSVYTHSTEQALYNGSVLSAIGLIRSIWTQLQEDGAKSGQEAAWHLLYSGGGMPELLPYLPKQGVYYPDLLMTGLAAIADN